MRPIKLTITGSGTTVPVVLDYLQVPFNVGIGVVVSGASSIYSIQHTFDAPFADYASSFSANASWFNYDNSNLVNATTSSDGNYAFPVTASRMTVSGTSTNSVTVYYIMGVQI